MYCPSGPMNPFIDTAAERRYDCPSCWRREVRNSRKWLVSSAENAFPSIAFIPGYSQSDFIRKRFSISTLRLVRWSCKLESTSTYRYQHRPRWTFWLDQQSNPQTYRVNPEIRRWYWVSHFQSTRQESEFEKKKFRDVCWVSFWDFFKIMKKKRKTSLRISKHYELVLARLFPASLLRFL